MGSTHSRQLPRPRPTKGPVHINEAFTRHGQPLVLSLDALRSKNPFKNAGHAATVTDRLTGEVIFRVSAKHGGRQMITSHDGKPLLSLDVEHRAFASTKMAAYLAGESQETNPVLVAKPIDSSRKVLQVMVSNRASDDGQVQFIIDCKRSGRQRGGSLTMNGVLIDYVSYDKKVDRSVSFTVPLGADALLFAAMMCCLVRVFPNPTISNRRSLTILNLCLTLLVPCCQ
ncbi:hypothetical protein IE81DRAFT_84201 [Ceraceosorus guamensis]|uniref:Tubby C-terminal domain-containing protein n=1 Tax=Ceraceosorus guamensis TaxID=1522189 RepID=A0A316WEE2_9BASI|nr:hypothetical protein IE81DRAFT_84201 [Ceraceosorus guamensis]PWN46133.1 hypothetical protein IE81DRAFT_84201 [Ceraceosorus guamensis]